MFIVDFLFRLPEWLLAVVLNVWLMGTALLGLWIVRRRVLPRLQIDQHICGGCWSRRGVRRLPRRISQGLVRGARPPPVRAAYLVGR